MERLQRKRDVSRRTAVVRRSHGGVLNGRKLSGLDETHPVNSVHHDPSKPTAIEGRKGSRQRIAELANGFPDLQHTVKDMIAEGEGVKVRRAVSLTHAGQFEGVRPTGSR